MPSSSNLLPLPKQESLFARAKVPGELDWTAAQRQKRAVAEYLAGLEAEAQVQEEADNGGGVLSKYGCPTGPP